MLTGYIDIAEWSLWSPTQQQLVEAQLQRLSLTLWRSEAKLNTRIIQPCLNICLVLEGLIQSLLVLKILWHGCVTSVSCSHLQINVSDPLDDAIRRPYQRIHILVLTLYPTGLQGLEVKHVDTTLKFFLTSRPVTCCNLGGTLSYLLVELEQLQQFDTQQQADLVELLSDVEVALKVMAGQWVQHAPVHQVIVEGLGVLGQAHVT